MHTLDPPTQSSVESQVKFYQTVCSKIGIVPISTYERQLHSKKCVLNYRKITDTEGKALSLPLQVSYHLLLLGFVLSYI